MDIQKDFADLCSLLNAKGVDFVIVGGYAVAFHGAPRFTRDLDILVRPATDQVQAMLAALRELGFPAQQIAADDLLQHQRILQLGQVPVQVHILTNITGVSWEEAWASRERGTYGGIPVHFIGREALMTNNRAASRSKDLADIEALGGTRE